MTATAGRTNGAIGAPYGSLPEKAHNDKPRIQLPRRWVETVIPVELPQMAREIIRRIRAEIPEYRRAMDGPYGRSMREGTEKALLGFMTEFFRTGELSEQSAQFFRGLGRSEALIGRSHDVLLAAYRTGTLAAWHRILVACEREPLPGDTIGPLAETIFGFSDRLARLSSEGYAAAQSDAGELSSRQRARLARMIVSQPDTPLDAILESATRLGWQIPERVVVLDVRSDEPEPNPAMLAWLGCEALAEWEQAARLVVLPAPVDAEAVARFVKESPGMHVAVGCTMPFAEAAQSLRWARLANRLREEHVMPDQAVTMCDDHVPLLLVHADPGIVELLVERRLGPLVALPPARRLKFGRLLSAWLERGGSQAELAESMQTHRQTLHYRVGRLQAMFGAQLHDPDARVEMSLALRAVLPRWEAEGDRRTGQ